MTGIQATRACQIGRTSRRSPSARRTRTRRSAPASAGVRSGIRARRYWPVQPGGGAVRADALDKHVGLGAREGGGECGALLLADRDERAGAFAPDADRDGPRHRRGGRPGALAVGEDVEVGERVVAHEPDRLLEVGVRLAREARNDVGAEPEPRDPRERALDGPTVLRGGVAAAHRAQDAVGAALQRVVQHRAEPRLRLAHQRDDLLLGRARLDGTHPDPREAGERGDGADEGGERPAALPPAGDVHAGEDDLAVSAGDERGAFGEDLVEGPRARLAARVGDDAVGAAERAAVLDLDECAHSVGKSLQGHVLII